MDTSLERKLSTLRRRIRKLDSALVAFSGGVDSTFLMRICREELGEKAVAVTALSDHYPSTELSLARRIARIIGAKHVVLDPHEEDSKPKSMNVCRGANIYSCLKSMAMRMKVDNVLDGSHTDDAMEKGKSFVAARRAGVRSPLLESDLSKAEIRLLAKELGLPNWDKPPSAAKPKAVKLPSPRKLELAKLYLESIRPGIKVEAKGKRAYLVIGKNTMISLAKNMESIQKKLRTLGFSEVLLKLT